MPVPRVSRDGIESAGRVVVWREAWLPLSETFVRNHVSHLERWSGMAAGIWRLPSATAEPGDHTFLDREPPSSTRARIALAGVLTPAQLCVVVRRFRPTLVHVHFLTDAIPVVRTAKLLRIPVVITVHGYDVSRWPAMGSRTGRPAELVRAYRRRAARHALRNAAAVIAVSEPIRAKAIELGARPERTLVRHLGIPFGTDPGPRDPGTAPIRALFVGRLSPKKGVDHLLRAWAALPRELAERAALTIVGDGEERDGLHRLARQLGVDVRFAGPLPAAAVEEEMQRSHILCMPSRTAEDGDVEGLPIVLLEAFALRLAVVAYRHSGIPEALTHDVEGLLVDEGDIDAYSAALARTLSDPDLRDRLGAAARRRVEAEFTIQRCIAELEALYDTVARAQPRD